VAFNVEALCEHLDSLVATSVAEVIMNNHEYRIGKRNAELLRTQKPEATVQEVIEQLSRAERQVGIGVVKVTLPRESTGAIDIEITNPCVKRTAGTAKALLATNWCGVLSSLFGGDFEAGNLTYHEAKNKITCKLSARRVRQT